MTVRWCYLVGNPHNRHNSKSTVPEDIARNKGFHSSYLLTIQTDILCLKIDSCLKKLEFFCREKTES